MRHDSWLCPPHCYEGCECEDTEDSWCNPYWVSGYCPTDGEGDECKANPESLIREPVANAKGQVIGFTYAVS